LVNQTMERRLDLFRRAAEYRGRSRERMTAVGVASDLFFQLYPDHVQTEHTIRISSLREKASEQRRLTLETCEARCSEVVRGVIGDAVGAGDLQLPTDYPVEQLAFGLWSLAFGGYSLAITSPSLANLGIPDPLLAMRNNFIRLLDGVGWKPLSSEVDLTQRIGTILREVFPAELAQVKRRK
jgi:hypothetical protein